MVNPAKNTICIWYDKDAEEAARFYARVFPDSSVSASPFFPDGKSPGARCTAPTDESGKVLA